MALGLDKLLIRSARSTIGNGGIAYLHVDGKEEGEAEESDNDEVDQTDRYRWNGHVWSERS